MGLSRQEYRCGLPFPSPADHVWSGPDWQGCALRPLHVAGRHVLGHSDAPAPSPPRAKPCCPPGPPAASAAGAPGAAPVWCSNPQAVSTLNPGPVFATLSSVRCPVAAVPRAVHRALTAPESRLSRFWTPGVGGSAPPAGSRGGVSLGGLPLQALGEGPSGSWQLQGFLSCGCVPPSWASVVTRLLISPCPHGDTSHITGRAHPAPE